MRQRVSNRTGKPGAGEPARTWTEERDGEALRTGTPKAKRLAIGNGLITHLDEFADTANAAKLFTT